MPRTRSYGITHHGYSPGKIGPITPLATSLSRCMFQPGFFLWAQAGGLCTDGYGIGEVQTVVILWVPDPPNVHLDGRKLVLPR